MAIPDIPEQSSQNIVLTGFMGTGKTTIGRRVAALLDRRFVDADDVIVERAGMSIPQIFATQGEAAFRALEKEVCRDLAAERGLVIATGGGMLVDPDNRAAMLASGLVVCLVASREVLRARLARGAERPLASDWEALLEKRRAAYAAIPDHIDTSDNSPERAAQRIIDLAYGLRGHHISVKTPTGEYDIAIQRGRLTHLVMPERCAVVTN
ncbi:MAG: shikimate kinase, partial [Anaerolineae bacterium]|nr:shikimate kinase [Anaerolineae bacterium]